MANQRFLTVMRSCFTAVPALSRILLKTFLLLTFTVTGCASSTTYRVLDAETMEPIEGAVALATWTRSTGLPGLISTSTVKAVEAVTNSEGFFKIPVVMGTLAMQKYHLKVYKPGYVGWNSKRIYLGYRGDDIKRTRVKKREGFVRKDQDLFLEPWKDEYSYISHGSFIRVLANLRKKAGLKNSKYEKAIEYEIPFRVRERKLYQKKERLHEK